MKAIVVEPQLAASWASEIQEPKAESLKPEAESPHL